MSLERPERERLIFSTKDNKAHVTTPSEVFVRKSGQRTTMRCSKKRDATFVGKNLEVPKISCRQLLFEKSWTIHEGSKKNVFLLEYLSLYGSRNRLHNSTKNKLCNLDFLYLSVILFDL